EEGVFPHVNATDEPGAVEEERRLAYVAITRARERLFLTHARSRSLYGKTQHNGASRFLSETGTSGVRVAGAGSDAFSGVGREKRGSRNGMYGDGTTSKAGSSRVFGSGATSKGAPGESFSPGDVVDHKVFGRGTVTDVQGDMLYVTFANGKNKKFLKGYTPIVKIV
ncbi:MAG: 3'-5' exonuclease, partial [Coriobacteriales bacterium]